MASMANVPLNLSPGVYRDHSQLTWADSGWFSMLHQQVDSSDNNGEPTFPEKLLYLLDELKMDGLNEIISWNLHGRSFRVHDQARFAREVLPRWFRQSKYSSFQRQLNLYDFRRVASGKDRGSYYHECFLRGKRFLCRYMKRTKVKGNRTRKANKLVEPNFYALPFLPPAPSEDAGANGNVNEKDSVAFHVTQLATSAEQQLALALGTNNPPAAGVDAASRVGAGLVASNALIQLAYDAQLRALMEASENQRQIALLGMSAPNLPLDPAVAQLIAQALAHHAHGNQAIQARPTSDDPDASSK